MIKLDNIKEKQQNFSVVEKRLVIGSNTKPKYQLLNGLNIMLSNHDVIVIPKGYVWDLSSVPRFLWWLLPADGDFEIAYIIHDYLYENRLYDRAFCDNEMLIWAKASSGTTNFSFRNLDNYVRYYGVRAFGWLVWKNIIKIS